MGKWNEEAAPNNNLTSTEIQSAMRVDNWQNVEFAEELADGGERNERFKKQKYKKRQNNLR
ncbi:hypothetical protein F9802_19100 [Bacillus aerolatus]|uniref:Uncharacterized protein n=1 Tax=Bacillus aerolatus TaxID=2653354 RepID=A0A6I1FAK5_9BACI|nr:hypothetical protein [Bacillus aerolatus]KAB7704061.1 hypothetical protein F9802_19100 [Bacillus aerolatus]